jgi:hypothetical protein
LQLDDVKKLGYLFPFVNIILAKWHYQYLSGVYLGAYIKGEVIIVQNKREVDDGKTEIRMLVVYQYPSTKQM